MVAILHNLGHQHSQVCFEKFGVFAQKQERWKDTKTQRTQKHKGHKSANSPKSNSQVWPVPAAEVWTTTRALPLPEVPAQVHRLKHSLCQNFHLYQVDALDTISVTSITLYDSPNNEPHFR